MSPLAPIDLNLAVHRLATSEAVSLESRLALVALRRGESEGEVRERLFWQENQPTAERHRVDKTA